MDCRFSPTCEAALLGTHLVPANLHKLNVTAQNALLSWYKDDIAFPDGFESEIEKWKEKWKDRKHIASVKEIIQANPVYFPSIFIVLNVVLTLPVTCSCEHSFSSLRRLKTWLRSSMEEDRLTGLDLFHVHRHLEVNSSKILHRWDSIGHRRIHLAFGKLSAL
ncbi:UNVERIFIED_CONTAM: hypothetical protein FKN15_007745 [Acipenser sinensis]